MHLNLKTHNWANFQLGWKLCTRTIIFSAMDVNLNIFII